MTKKPNKKSKRLPPDDERARIIRELEAKVASLEEELRRRNLEASFLESALRKVEAVRRRTLGTEPEETGGTSRYAGEGRKPPPH